MKAGFLSLIFALAISTPSSPAVLAQTPPDTPETVAKAYFAATQTADWAEAASFMHPDSLAQIKKLFELIFANEKSAKNEKSAIPVGAFIGVNSRAELDQLSGAQVFEKFMSGFGGLITGNADFLLNLLGKSSFDIIGQITETPDVVHVLYRTQIPFDNMQFKDAPDQLKDAPNLFKNVTFTTMWLLRMT